MKYPVCIFLSLFLCEAHAAWTGSDRSIDDIFTDISNVQSTASSIKTTLNGNLSETANDLKRQLQQLNELGMPVKTTVEEILEWLQSRQTRYDDFVGSGKCGGGSPCAAFRANLKTFTQDIANLSDRFPIVEKLGIGDGQIIADILDRMPPLVLFATYEAMNRLPDWQSIPAKLSDIYDEIGDPEVFTVNLEPRTDAAMTSGLVFAASTTTSTPTQKFCNKKADKLDGQIDPVRLNRIKNFVFMLKTVLDVGAEYTPDTVGLSLVGEGADGLKLPLKPTLKAIKGIIEVIQSSVDTYRANIAICKNNIREIELQVAQCVWLDDFIRPSTNDEVYNVVKNQIESADSEGISVVTAYSFLHKAENRRALGNYKKAYHALCHAYAEIGE